MLVQNNWETLCLNCFLLWTIISKPKLKMENLTAEMESIPLIQHPLPSIPSPYLLGILECEGLLQKQQDFKTCEPLVYHFFF